MVTGVQAVLLSHIDHLKARPLPGHPSEVKLTHKYLTNQELKVSTYLDTLQLQVYVGNLYGFRLLLHIDGNT